MTSRRSLFRPCIDLHDGHVKQIVGGTLSELDPGSLKTNFVAKYAMGAAPRHPIQLTWYEEKRLETLHGCTNYTDWKVDI
jgi:phosphoribosylformimino-5-aminoimidazole carboxamide ribotide isomerase